MDQELIEVEGYNLDCLPTVKVQDVENETEFVVFD